MKDIKPILTIVIIFVFMTTVSAQFKNWSNLVSFNGGYVMLTSEETDNSISGYAFDFSYEQVNTDGTLAGGVMITYLAAHEDDNEINRRINYQSIPITLQGKYLFGSEMVKGYLLGGIGVQFSRIEFAGPNLLLQDGDSGVALVLGLGGYFFTDEKIFINAAYNFNYLGNSFYRDGMVHLFKIGIGFQSI